MSAHWLCGRAAWRLGCVGRERERESDVRDDAHEGGGESGEEEVVVDEVGGGLLDTEESGEWVVCVWIRRRGDDGQRKSGERRKNERHRVSALVGEGGREGES